MIQNFKSQFLHQIICLILLDDEFGNIIGYSKVVIYIKSNNKNKKSNHKQILIVSSDQKMQQLVKTLIFYVLIIIFIGISQTTGPIINMLLMMGFDYPAKVSISLTYLFLAGGSLASIWKIAARRNAQTGKTMVKLDLILLTAPCMCSGALFGGVFKSFFSEIMITVLFILLFLFLIYDLIKSLKAPVEPVPVPSSSASPFISSMAPKPSVLSNEPQLQDVFQLKQMGQQGTLTESLIKSSPNLQSKTAIEYQARSNSRSKLIKVVIMFFGYYIFSVATYLCRGTHKTKSIIGINTCGFEGWALIFGHLLISIIISVIIARQIVNATQGLNEQQIKKYSIQVTQRNVWYFLIAGFVGGFLAALMAIGASIVLVPTWMKFGVDKNYAGNSTSTLILLASLITFSNSYFNHAFDHVPHYTLVFYFVLSFVSSALVRDLLGIITRKYKLEHMVIYMLLIVLVITLVALVPFQIGRIMRDYRQVLDLGFLC